MTGDSALYVWGCYAMGLALAVVEITLLQLRYRSIVGCLGRHHRTRHSATMPLADAPDAGPRSRV